MLTAAQNVRCSVTGSYLVSVLLHGEHITGSPWAAHVVGPGHDPSQCRIFAPAGGIAGSVLYPAGVDEVHSVAGQPACFDMAFHDALGRAVPMEEANLHLSITPWRSLQDALASSEAFAVRVPNAVAVEIPTVGRALANRIDHMAISAQPTPEGYADQRRLVSVVMTSAGRFHLHVGMQPRYWNQEMTRAKGSPLRLTVRPAEANAQASRCLATPIQLTMLAGQQRSFTVVSYDRFGNACDAGGACVALEGVAIASGDVSHQVVDHGNGEYQVRWACKLAGEYHLKLLLDGKPVAAPARESASADEEEDSREVACRPRDAGAGESSSGCGGDDSPCIRLSVKPNALCAKTTTVSGAALTSAVAGERGVIRIHGKDWCGNAVLPLASIRFGIRLRCRSPRQQLLDVSAGSTVSAGSPEGEEDAANVAWATGDQGGPGWRLAKGRWLAGGEYEVDYFITVAGSYDLHLWYASPKGEATELSVSPSALEVAPNVADSRGSKLILESTHGAHHSRLENPTRVLIAGSYLTAAVQVADRYGNPTWPLKSELSLTLDAPDDRGGDLSSRLQACTRSNIEPIGLYTITEELQRSGEYTFRAAIRGLEMPGSPLAGGPISVCAASPEGAHSILDVPTSQQAQQPVTIFVHCRDRFGNAPELSALQEYVTSGAVSARVDGPTWWPRPAFDLLAHDDGSVELTIVASLSGGYDLTVWICGTALPACPHLLSVDAQPFARKPSASCDTSLQASGPAREPRTPREGPGKTAAAQRDTSPTTAGSTPSGISPRPLATSSVRLLRLEKHRSRVSPPRSPTRAVDELTERGGSYAQGHYSHYSTRGCMPTSPRRSTSPRTWHGLPRAQQRREQTVGAHVSMRLRSPGNDKARGSVYSASRLAALASPRTPPLTEGRTRPQRLSARDLQLETRMEAVPIAWVE